jgi:hypothetical protein
MLRAGIRRSITDAVLLPLLFTLVLRAFVPVGYMPTWTSDAGPRLVWCSAGSPAPAQDHSPNAPPARNDTPCPFAATGAAPVPTAPWQVLPVLLVVAATATTPVSAQPGNSAPRRHTAPRGPPVSATLNR